MPARRRLLLAITFLGCAALLASGRPVRAQFPTPSTNSPGQHELFGQTLTREQVEAALAQLMRGDKIPPEVLDQLKKAAGKDNPKFDPKMFDQLRRELEANPELRKRVDDLARQLKQQGKGQAPPELPEDVLKQLRNLPGFPKTQPDAKGRTAPPDGDPIKPGSQPKVGNPVTPKVEPPKNDPMVVPDVPPPANDPKLPDIDPKLPGDQVPPFQQKEPPTEQSKQAFRELWERNFGPLDETPAVKQALFDIVEGTADFKDADGKNILDSLGKETGDSTFADLIKDAGAGDSWTLPKLDLDWDKADAGGGRTGSGSGSGDSWWSRLWGSSPNSGSGSRSSGNNWSAPSAPSVGGGGFSLPGIGGPWVQFLLLLLIAIIIIVVLKLWFIRGSSAQPVYDLGGLGGWPIDPRRITTREHVVLAFEYLGVLLCGATARTWTHTTIAQALADLAAAHGETAVMLARLYELARYTPLDEPLTTAEVAEARRLVCRLAGLEYE